MFLLGLFVLVVIMLIIYLLILKVGLWLIKKFRESDIKRYGTELDFYDVDKYTFIMHLTVLFIGLVIWFIYIYVTT